jgi:enoyl-CoA hydratase
VTTPAHTPGSVERTNEGPVAVLELTRRGRRNAWGPDMADDLIRHLTDITADDKALACVVTGADGTFSSGVDLGQDHVHSTPSAGAFLRSFDPHRHAVFSALLEFRKPLICAVAGPAIGLGFVLALHCDVILASDSARFALPNTKLGILPSSGALVRLAQWVGRGRALDIGLTGRMVGAEEAVAIGLAVSRLPGDDTLRAAAMEYANMLASYPPLAVWATKESLDTGLEAGSPRLARLMDGYRLGMLQMTEDSAEAHTAWREKREPRYRME